MKKLIVLLLICNNVYSQYSSFSISKSDSILMTTKSGSCGSPDGPMNPITGAPGSYAWLQTNGYCNPNTYGNNVTVCWTFTPTSSSVTINSGYSQTGCANTSFGSFNLYSNTCTLLGSGLSFTGLTPGQSYTWCMSGSAWGGGPSCTGFDDFCPYYTNNIVLPIELEIFAGHKVKNHNYIYWVTATEINNDHFTLDRSTDGINWEYLDIIPGGGNTNIPSMYEYKDYEYTDITCYYRLTQTDFNGNTETFKIISVTGSKPKKEKPVAYDTLGRVIPDPNAYIGIIIFKYKSGFWYKVTRFK